MDDALALSKLMPILNNIRSVLILVVMDDALALTKKEFLTYDFVSLNPCCNG